MYVISYQESETQRYDASYHTVLRDAQDQLIRFGDQLLDPQIEEKDTFNPKPVVL